MQGLTASRSRSHSPHPGCVPSLEMPNKWWTIPGMSEQPSVFHLLPCQVIVTMLRDTPGEELDHRRLSACVIPTLFVLLQQERWKNRSNLPELNCTQLQTPHGGTGWFVWNPCDLRVDNGQRLSCSPIVRRPEEVGHDTPPSSRRHFQDNADSSSGSIYSSTIHSSSSSSCIFNLWTSQSLSTDLN